MSWTQTRPSGKSAFKSASSINEQTRVSRAPVKPFSRETDATRRRAAGRELRAGDEAAVNAPRRKASATEHACLGSSVLDRNTQIKKTQRRGRRAGVVEVLHDNYESRVCGFSANVATGLTWFSAHNAHVSDHPI